MAYDADHGQMVLFGGGTNGDTLGFLNDTWTWDGTNWTQQSLGKSPAARILAAMAYDADHNQVVLFGGDDSNGVPGKFCTSGSETNWYGRSQEWHEERGLQLSRS
jgi:hypothetical protein